MTDTAGLAGPKKSLWAWTAGTFFGIGLMKPGPGTWGSVAAAAIWLGYAMLTGTSGTSLTIITAIAAAIALAIGIPAANVVSRESGSGDPQMVVLDEVVGQWITLLFVRADWEHALVGLIFFRVFDILKLPPARQLDNMHGGTGVMLDDVAAGAQALICMALVHKFLHW
jgi:phosphatidylglycerophosphatase A